MAETFQTVAEASKQTGYSPDHIRRLARSKTIPAKKVGPTILVSVPALLKHKLDNARYNKGRIGAIA